MINWRDRYVQSQSIQSTEEKISTERIRRLVNIYKNNLIEQDLQRYAQRLSIFVRCCQTCTPKSYNRYKWIDTSICSMKNLLDLHFAGRSVSPFVYFWKKTLSDISDDRGKLSDFQQNRSTRLSISILSNMDENLVIQKKKFVPKWISHCIRRFQMYYTYRKVQSLSPSIEVHLQILKSCRSFSQNNLAPVFYAFIDETTDVQQYFWTFRHMTTVLNWPSTTKIFSSRSYRTNSSFERMMTNSLGFVDFSFLNPKRLDIFSYLYRCLKTCAQNGPVVLLFDRSTMYNPTSSDYQLLCFLVDLVRFDLSIPDLLFIPSRLQSSSLAFSQPFLFKEFIHTSLKTTKLKQSCCELLMSEEQEKLHPLMIPVLSHLAYDANQLVSTTMHVSHLLAAAEPTQRVSNEDNTLLIFKNVRQSCPFIDEDHHQWKEITQQDIDDYRSKSPGDKLRLIVQLRTVYFLDVVAALAILSKLRHDEKISYVLETDLIEQSTFLLHVFGTKESLVLGSCQQAQEIIPKVIQLCQSRNYIVTEDLQPKSMTYRETVVSDHEWSEEEDEDNMADLIDEDIDDQHDMLINDGAQHTIEPIKSFFRVNIESHQAQMKFFAKLFYDELQAMIVILHDHIERNLSIFTLNQRHETLDIAALEYLRRAYAYRMNHLSSVTITLDQVSPLNANDLVALRDEFVYLVHCCCE